MSLAYVDSDLVVIPMEWYATIRLGSVRVDEGFYYLTVPKQTTWIPYAPLQDLLAPGFNRVDLLVRTLDAAKAGKPWFKTATVALPDGSELRAEPVMCCALDLKAFAEQQLEDQLPTGQHNVVVAMYGAWCRELERFLPIAIAVAPLLIKTTAEIHDAGYCTYERSWSWASMPQAVLEQSQKNVSIVLE
jgi:hypothetical protein